MIKYNTLSGPRPEYKLAPKRKTYTNKFEILIASGNLAMIQYNNYIQMLNNYEQKKKISFCTEIGEEAIYIMVE